MCYSAMIQKDLEYLHKNYGANYLVDEIESYENFHQQDPKKFPRFSSRIYPGYYAPAIHMDPKGDRRSLKLMRYSTGLPSFMDQSSKNYTSFNARLDNLDSKFWSEAFLSIHGVLVIKSFFEWVTVKDLLSAGVVKIDQVKADFEQQSAKRKAKLLAQGKVYKPTKTETMDARFRKTMIQFKPAAIEQDLLVPVIISKFGDGDETQHGFALITDDPPKEIAAAGHDRCPIILKESAVDDWISMGKKAKEYKDILNQRETVSFSHTLDKAA